MTTAVHPTNLSIVTSMEDHSEEVENESISGQCMPCANEDDGMNDLLMDKGQLTIQLNEEIMETTSSCVATNESKGLEPEDLSLLPISSSSQQSIQSCNGISDLPMKSDTSPVPINSTGKSKSEFSSLDDTLESFSRGELSFSQQQLESLIAARGLNRISSAMEQNNSTYLSNSSVDKPLEMITKDGSPRSIFGMSNLPNEDESNYMDEMGQFVTAGHNLSRASKNSSKKSVVWQYFNYEVMPNGSINREKTICSLCGNGLCFNSSGTTTTMLNHLKSKHPETCDRMIPSNRSNITRSEMNNNGGKRSANGGIIKSPGQVDGEQQDGSIAAVRETDGNDVLPIVTTRGPGPVAKKKAKLSSGLAAHHGTFAKRNKLLTIQHQLQQQQQVEQSSTSNLPTTQLISSVPTTLQLNQQHSHLSQVQTMQQQPQQQQQQAQPILTEVPNKKNLNLLIDQAKSILMNSASTEEQIHNILNIGLNTTAASTTLSGTVTSDITGACLMDSNVGVNNSLTFMNSSHNLNNFPSNTFLTATNNGNGRGMNLTSSTSNPNINNYGVASDLSALFSNSNNSNALNGQNYLSHITGGMTNLIPSSHALSSSTASTGDSGNSNVINQTGTVASILGINNATNASLLALQQLVGNNSINGQINNLSQQQFLLNLTAAANVVASLGGQQQQTQQRVGLPEPNQTTNIFSPSNNWFNLLAEFAAKSQMQAAASLFPSTASFPPTSLPQHATINSGNTSFATLLGPLLQMASLKNTATPLTGPSNNLFLQALLNNFICGNSGVPTVSTASSVSQPQSSISIAASTFPASTTLPETDNSPLPYQRNGSFINQLQTNRLSPPTNLVISQPDNQSHNSVSSINLGVFENRKEEPSSPSSEATVFVNSEAQSSHSRLSSFVSAWTKNKRKQRSPQKMNDLPVIKSESHALCQESITTTSTITNLNASRVFEILHFLLKNHLPYEVTNTNEYISLVQPKTSGTMTSNMPAILRTMAIQLCQNLRSIFSKESNDDSMKVSNGISVQLWRHHGSRMFATFATYSPSTNRKIVSIDEITNEEGLSKCLHELCDKESTLINRLIVINSTKAALGKDLIQLPCLVHTLNKIIQNVLTTDLFVQTFHHSKSTDVFEGDCSRFTARQMLRLIQRTQSPEYESLRQFFKQLYEFLSRSQEMDSSSGQTCEPSAALILHLYWRILNLLEDNRMTLSTQTLLLHFLESLVRGLETVYFQKGSLLAEVLLMVAWLNPDVKEFAEKMAVRLGLVPHEAACRPWIYNLICGLSGRLVGIESAQEIQLLHLLFDLYQSKDLHTSHLLPKTSSKLHFWEKLFTSSVKLEASQTNLENVFRLYIAPLLSIPAFCSSHDLNHFLETICMDLKEPSSTESDQSTPWCNASCLNACEDRGDCHPLDKISPLDIPNYAFLLANWSAVSMSEGSDS